MRNCLLLCLLFLSQFVWGQVNNPLKTEDYESQLKWVDSVYNRLTLKERIGQLFMVQAFSNKAKSHEKEIENLIINHNIGGIIFSKGGPIRQARLTNRLQSVSEVPLLIGMDAEWGLSMRLDSTFAFPWNMTLGAIKNDSLIRQTGVLMGEHCKRLGVHFNFAPVVDINTNPNNPIIGNRSFGSDKYNVTSKASLIMEGMQSVGVLANAKHFPGHGDTDTDSHKTLPTINFSKKRIKEVELYPYKTLINRGLSSVMVAHLNIPSLEPRDGYPSSISKSIVNDILKNDLQFEGLIFTDALNMKGASNFKSPGLIDLEAFKAGNDVLLISENIPKAILKIRKAINDGIISEERLEYSVKKILMAKYKCGLNNYTRVSSINLIEDLNRLKDKIHYENLAEHAITVVKNSNELLPVENLINRKIGYLGLGDSNGDDFYNTLNKYTKVEKIQAKRLDELLKESEPYDLIIIGFHKSNTSPWKPYKFSAKERAWMHELSRKKKVILDIFTSPYALLNIPSFKNIESVIVSYQNSPSFQNKSAQIIFGGLSAKGFLPVNINKKGIIDKGIETPFINRLSYGKPETVGMSSDSLNKIDSLAKYSIQKLMTPGIQILVARKGKVIYNKNFGHHTYEKSINVTDSSIYDVASLTKILATLPVIMSMEEKNILNLEDSLSYLLPDYKNTNKSGITIKSMLSHYSKLQPWIPFYVKTIDSISNKPLKELYHNIQTKDFPTEVANQMYLAKSYKDSIYNTIKFSELLPNLEYKYSDLPYYILKDYIESNYKIDLNLLIDQLLFSPIGAYYTSYLPLKKNLSNIVPTEVDSYFRHQEIKGYVHDMGAAMLGGVGGHAGVFSTANDVAKIMQMYLNKGKYGGKTYFSSDTIDKFNTCYFCANDNRRGVGFDKPQLSDEGPTCGCVSMSSFGHSGFTGTYTWADPDEELVYVFMSNRTYPDASNNLLIKENIRTEIQRFIYEAIIE